MMIERRHRLLGPAYRLFYDEPFHPVRGAGVWLYDAAGTAYLDAYNNVASVGHCHPRVVAALAAQSARLNTHTRYLDDTVLDYAERLLATLPDALQTMMFTCTGSEANDLALRIARMVTGGAGFVVTENAYHGVTSALAEMSPSLGLPLGAHVRSIAAPGKSAEFASDLQAAIDDLSAAGIRFAGFLCDSIFASDGIFSDPVGLLQSAIETTHRNGGLYIADEVQSGFGRTGSHMWGFARHGVVPDMVSMGKPMGDGHPLAGLAMRPDLSARFGAETRYFNTFGGNPVSSAVGIAVLDVMADEELQQNAAEVGAYLKAGLQSLAGQHETITDIRGAGLYLGVELRDGAAAVVNQMRAKRVLLSAAGPQGNVLKIRPPLVFSRENADQLLSVLDECLGG
ncbi:aspartate aminotransferase family protein [Govanella unica]|uniref:Aminotransferase class III-fold pyridoxal phosphate-dependent enzyme n=1 Tax=Govanella unica TaxID=2975056 RepID=A0A9X3TWF6_9PROT|nr:aminotransferase class III-fold pyridoxal phosphate-dependent enzyme [Govania unica]MDA5192697.1 aminotransferase class III-fold pyridoxal phosphate-dependent enzyme [Govania unica]